MTDVSRNGKKKTMYDWLRYSSRRGVCAWGVLSAGGYAAFVLNYSGFKQSDTQSVLDIAPTASTLADVNSTKGSYDITIAGGSDNNYNLQYTYPTGV